MAGKRSLIDTAQDPNAKDAFIKEGIQKPVKKNRVETKMLNTRVPKELLKRVKAYCVEHEITVQDFVTQTLEEKLKQ